MPASSWVDDYYSWLDPSSTCCRILHKQSCSMVNVTKSISVNGTVVNSTKPVLKCGVSSEPVSPLTFCNATGKLIDLSKVCILYNHLAHLTVLAYHVWSSVSRLISCNLEHSIYLSNPPIKPTLYPSINLYLPHHSASTCISHPFIIIFVLSIHPLYCQSIYHFFLSISRAQS